MMNVACVLAAVFASCAATARWDGEPCFPQSPITRNATPLEGGCGAHARAANSAAHALQRHALVANEPVPDPEEERLPIVLALDVVAVARRAVVEAEHR